MGRNHITAAYQRMLKKKDLFLIPGNSNIFVFLSNFKENILNLLILQLYSVWTLYPKNNITIQTFVFIKHRCGDRLSSNHSLQRTISMYIFLRTIFKSHVFFFLFLRVCNFKFKIYELLNYLIRVQFSYY